MTFLLMVLIWLATYRVTRLLTKDDLPLVAAPRRWVVRRFGVASTVGYLVTCAWCVSMYVGAGLVAVTDLVVDVRYPWLVWLSSSAVTGLLSYTGEE